VDFLSFSPGYDQGSVIFPPNAVIANPDVGDSAPNATVRSCESGETGPERSGAGLVYPYDPASTGDHDQESGLGLAWCPTGPGVCAARSTPASVLFGAPVKCLASSADSRVTFFVDSGAGQCLCSVSGAFTDLQPCHIEVTGVSGTLPIYGCGTANFVAKDHAGSELIVRIPNCLYERGEFNLLSVSQFNQVKGNRVDFSLTSPMMVLALSPGSHRTSVRVPLVLEDGLFALHVEPLGEGDPR
jgi:hypothetical protein